MMLKLKILVISILAAITLSVNAQSAKQAIAIPFTLKKAGFVTLVIEDENGMRVRNLVSETWFNAGKNTAWWDGQDDLGRDMDAAGHSLYRIPPKLVEAGSYIVRGLVHPKIKTSYQLPVYSTGNPPWTTNNHTGGWLANHTPPQAAVFVPAAQSPTNQPLVFLGSYVTEGPDGLAWVDLDGKKIGGKTLVGGAWTGAPYMARDAGDKAVAGVSVYTAAAWKAGDKSSDVILRISSLPKNGDKPIFTHPIRTISVITAENLMAEISGFAIFNGIGVASLPKVNQLIFMDLRNGKLVGTASINSPSGLAFDQKGHLLVLSGNKLLKFTTIQDVVHLPAVQTVIGSGLDSPVGITVDGEGKLYISNAGNSHQVKVFSENGKFIRAIGHPGAPKAGPYDPLHMNNPAGITIDSRQQLWVAENDFLPKRVSVWSLDGKLIKAFYGPAKYGGGGTLDPQDKSKFYYSHNNSGTMEFSIDWKTGTSKLQQVLYRESSDILALAARNSAPETPIYYKGKRYFTNCYNSNPTGGSSVAFLFVERKGVLQPVAAMGRADNWAVLKEARFKSGLPAGLDLNSKTQNSLALFIWSDLNEDGQVQPEEVVFKKGSADGITIMPDLSFCIAQFNSSALTLSPQRFTTNGIPVYQLDNAKLLINGVLPPGSSGGNQALTTPEGWTVLTLGIMPFSRYSITGVKNGRPVWSYPDLWPGLHAAHVAPVPTFAGELIGTTRLLGGTITIKGTDAGPLWAINSNHGMVYLFTIDGLFVTTLFEPMRGGKPWNMQVADRGMNLNGISLGEENFWPTISNTIDGEVYLVDGARTSLVKVDGLQNIERLPSVTVNVTSDDLKKSLNIQAKNEIAMPQTATEDQLKVVIQTSPIVVDGKFDDWQSATWVDIDKEKVKGAVVVSGSHLYLGYQTGDAMLLKNSDEIPTAPFKTGGALDLMFSTTQLKHKAPVAGDIRLLVTLVNGKPRALIYRAVVPGTKESDKIPFSSPSRTITFDRVDDVTTQIEFAADNGGNYEISLPLALLNLKPENGMSIRGDIGILRGDGAHTLSRIYWSNKATSIVSDVPSEAELTPELWGTWKFQAP